MKDKWGDKERGIERSIGLRKARFQRVKCQRHIWGVNNEVGSHVWKSMLPRGKSDPIERNTIGQ